MKKTGIMTDSHSGILENEASKLGIAVLPMPFYIDEKLIARKIISKGAVKPTFLHEI